MQKEGKQKNILNQTKSTAAMWKMYNFFIQFQISGGKGFFKAANNLDPVVAICVGC